MAAYFRLAQRYGAPIDLPTVQAGFGHSWTPVGGSQVTLGAAEVSQVVAWRRTWALSFGVITDAQATDVAKWIDGTYGRGPFELWIGAATLPVVVNVYGYDPQPLFLGYQMLTLTLREVLL